MNEMLFIVNLTVELDVCVAVTKAEADEMEGQVDERGVRDAMTAAQLAAYDKALGTLPEIVCVEGWSISPVLEFESLPADECFVIRHVSRKSIAELCNDYLQVHGIVSENIAPDDARLTKTICSTYASAMTQVLAFATNDDDAEEMEQNAIAAVVTAMGIIIPDTN